MMQQILTLAVVFAASCSAPASKPKSLVPTERIRSIVSDQVDYHPTRSISASEFYLSLSDVQKEQFIESIIAALSEQLPVEMPRDKKMAALSLQLGIEASDSIFETLNKLIAAEPKKFDRILNISLDDVSALQTILFNTRAKVPAIAGIKFNHATNLISFQAEGCEARTTTRNLVNAGLGLYQTSIYKDKFIDPCYFENSEKLSMVLNILSESLTQQLVRPLSLSINGSKVRMINRFSELLEMLQDAGLTAEVYGGRNLVDFFGYSVRREKNDIPLRLPAWFKSQTPAGELAVPGEHSELGILIHDGSGNRYAQVRYFIGVPETTTHNAVSFWRPDHFKRPAWQSYALNFVRQYKGNKLAEAKTWLRSVAVSMAALEIQQSHQQLPLNSYGFFVCSDSVVLATAVFQKLSGEGLDTRMTHAFPLIRSKEFTEPTIKLLGGLMTAEEFDGVYPVDYTLGTEDFTKRVKTAFPERERWRLREGFSDFSVKLQTLDP